jgi:hypothetical protein
LIPEASFKTDNPVELSNVEATLRSRRHPDEGVPYRDASGKACTARRRVTDEVAGRKLIKKLKSSKHMLAPTDLVIG